MPSVKERLASGDVVIGTLVMEFGTTGIARIGAAAGAEFVLYDCEHTGWTPDRIRPLVESARAAGLDPFVRIPEVQCHLVAQTLDAGATGLMVPALGSADEADAFVSAAKFPPVGERRFGIVHSDAPPPRRRAAPALGGPAVCVSTPNEYEKWSRQLTG